MPGRRTDAVVASLTLLALLVPLTGCGGGSGETPSPTTSPTMTGSTPTRSPDRTQAPTPTPTPTESPSATRTPGPTRTAAPAPTSAAPSPTAATSTRTVTVEPTPTPTPTTAAPSPTAATSSAEAAPESSSTASDEASGDDGVPSWVWWLLAALVISAAVLIPLLIARSRRADWQQRLAAARAEVGWLARELLPQLRATGSLEGVAGGWQIALPRVAAVEDELTVLESSAKSEEDALSARVLRDAVRASQERVEAVLAGGADASWALDLDDVVVTLESALAARTPTA